MSNFVYLAFYLPVVVPAEQTGALNITLNHELSVNFLNQSSIPSSAQHGAPPPGPTPRRRNPHTMNVPTRSTETPPYPFPRRRKDLLEGPAPGCKIHYGALPPPGMMPRRRNPSTFGVPPVEEDEDDVELEEDSKTHYGTPPTGPVTRRLNPRTLYAPMMHYDIPPAGRYPRRRNPLKMNTPSVPKLHFGTPPVGRYPRRLDPVKLATPSRTLPRRFTLPPSRLRPRTRRTSRFALHRRGSDNTCA